MRKLFPEIEKNVKMRDSLLNVVANKFNYKSYEAPLPALLDVKNSNENRQIRLYDINTRRQIKGTEQSQEIDP